MSNTDISDTEKVAWVRKQLGFEEDWDECMSIYAIYMQYRSEGQSDIVSRQYAGLPTGVRED